MPQWALKGWSGAPQQAPKNHQNKQKLYERKQVIPELRTLRHWRNKEETGGDKKKQEEKRRQEHTRRDKRRTEETRGDKNR